MVGGQPPDRPLLDSPRESLTGGASTCSLCADDFGNTDNDSGRFRRQRDRGVALGSCLRWAQALATLSPKRRARARERRTLRRSRSDNPPQIPNFSPLASAYSKQSTRTSQPRHTSLASRVDAPRSGKNNSGSTPRQLARLCHDRFASRDRTVVNVGSGVGKVEKSDIQGLQPSPAGGW